MEEMYERDALTVIMEEMYHMDTLTVNMEEIYHREYTDCQYGGDV